MEGASLANILNNEQESTEEPAVPATPSQRAGSIHHLVAPYNEPSHRSPSIEHRSSTRSSLADLLSPVDQPVITSNGAVAPQNGLDLLASVGSIEAVRQEESLVEQPRDDSIDDKQEVGGETPPLEDLPAHNDLAAQIFPANESVDPKPEPELPRPALPLPPKPATSLPIRLEYKPSKRLTAPLSVLEPLSKQEHNYYTDPRNCLNPLRTGSGVTLVAEGKFRPSRPDFDEAAAASAETSYSTSRKRERESAEAVSAGPPDQTHPMSPSHSAEFQQQEQQQNEWQDAHHWQAKRQRRGPVDAFNKHSEVAAHYNARGNTGRQARTQSATYGLKVCNNWIKSILIRRFVRRRPGVTDFNPESNPRDTKPNGRVLDMGCGKGGDIEKWNKARVADYVGIDVASGSIQDFEQRLRTSRRRLAYRTHLYVLDCFSYPIDLVVPTDLLTPKFDTVSMQFCMHYAFESERKVRQMLENVAGSLRTGGVFLGTTLSAPKVLCVT